MSTPTIPTDDWTTGRVSGRRGAARNPPSLVAELVFRELLEAESALSEDDLHDRTLLPEAEVREAIAELEARDLCTTRRRRSDREPRWYVASFPHGLES